jgi:alkylation response protein AidB-like acyl-CoA dehydrogenase
MDAMTPLRLKLDDLAAEFALTAAENDRDGTFPFNNFARLHDEGLLALTVPQALGGRGAPLASAVEVVGAIARGCPSTALVLAMQYISHRTIAHAPSWAQHLKERLGRDAVRTGALVNALRVEPDLGSPGRGGLPATIAVRTATGWRLSGRKIYSTGIPILKWLLVWARTDEAEPRVGSFLVPASSPGITIEATWDQLGMRATRSDDVILTEVDIPADHAVDIRAPDDWLTQNREQSLWNAVLVPSIYDGVARSARDWVVQFAKSRVPSNLGKPLATLPRFQEAIGEIETLLAVNARLIASYVRDVEIGAVANEVDGWLVKLTVTRNAISIVEEALKLSGNHGISRANPLERHYRDVLCGRIHTPQDDSVRVAAGRRALGL